MSNSLSLNNKYLIPIKYKNNKFSDINNNSLYIFSLTINGDNINNINFKNIENNKYSHMIKLDNQINLSDIEFYKVSVKVLTNNITIESELNGIISHTQSSSTECNNNLYIEFTQNENGYAICTCFYTDLVHNKLFVSPPN